MSQQENNSEDGKKTPEEKQKQEFERQVQAFSQQLANVQFWKFVNGENYKVTVANIMKNLASSRQTFLFTYLFDIGLVLLLLGAVVFLGYSKILDGVTIGTLVGAIIGYALGRFRQD
ncbi:MAG: hypothetical protein R8G66_33860 [Cytophagales bacterium]|nr:hypothetical protein [Cytophagales bacterium]MDW3197413.1 hypothetical protein [Cytophagales bacterium]